VSAADRFAITALMEQLELFVRQLREADGRLRKFGKSGPLAEREARAILDSIPMVGPVTIDVPVDKSVPIDGSRNETHAHKSRRNPRAQKQPRSTWVSFLDPPCNLRGTGCARVSRPRTGGEVRRAAPNATLAKPAGRHYPGGFGFREPR